MKGFRNKLTSTQVTVPPNMKTIIKTFCLFFLILEACSPENTDSLVTHFRLQKKYSIVSIMDSTVLAIDTFIYSSGNRLVKIIHDTAESPGHYLNIGYTDFHYDPNGQLTSKTTFSTLGGDTFSILDSVCYQYENNKLIKEDQYYPMYGDSSISFLYEYDGPLLKKKIQTSNILLINWTFFEYSGKQCMRESVYTDSAGKKEISHVLHIYIDDVKIRSEFFKYDYLLRQIDYYYDTNGNLSLEESAGGFWYSNSNFLDYTYRYEYKKVSK
jgi:hypothetical protein